MSFSLSEERSKDSFTFHGDHHEIDITDEHEPQMSMLSPTGSVDTGHGASPLSMAQTVTDTGTFSECDGLDSHLTNFQQAQTEWEEEIAQLKNQVSQLRLENDDLQRKNKDLHRTIVYIEEHRNQIPDDDSSTTESDETVLHIHGPGKAKKKSHEIIALLNDTEELDTEIRRLRTENKNLLQKVSDLQGCRKKARQLENMYGTAKSEADRYRVLHDDHVRQIDHLSMELAIAKNKNSDKVAQLEATIKDLRTRIETCDPNPSFSKAYTEKIKFLEQNLKEKEEKIADLNEKSKSLVTEHQSTSERNLALQEELKNLQANYDALLSNANTEWEKERGALHQQIEELNEAMKHIEAIHDNFKDASILSEGPAAVRSWSFTDSDRNASPLPLPTPLSNITETSAVPIWKLLPRDIRHSLGDYATSDSGKPTSCGRAIRKLKKLTIGLKVDDHEGQATFVVDLSDSPNASMSRSLNSIASSSAPPRKTFKDASTDCDGLYIVQFDRNQTPLSFSQDSLLAASSPVIGSRDKLLMEEAQMASRLVNEKFSATNSGAPDAVNVSIQADQLCVQKLQQDCEMFQRTISQLRDDLQKKGADIQRKDEECQELFETAELLESEKNELAEALTVRDKKIAQLDGEIEKVMKDMDEMTADKRVSDGMIEQLKTDNKNLDADKAELDAEKRELSARADRLQADVNVLMKEVAALKSNEKELIEAIADVDADEEELKEEFADAVKIGQEERNMRIQLETRCSELERHNIDLQKSVDKTIRYYKQRSAEVEGFGNRFKQYSIDLSGKLAELQKGNHDREKFIKVTGKRLLAIVELLDKKGAERVEKHIRDMAATFSERERSQRQSLVNYSMMSI